jgi:hypothetical protein
LINYLISPGSTVNKMASTQIILRKNKNAAARARRPNIYFCEGEFVATRAFFDPWGRGEGGVGSGEWGWGRGGGVGGREGKERAIEHAA